jgi:phage repressor protein C with HTH and peptisase S24 domain
MLSEKLGKVLTHVKKSHGVKSQTEFAVRTGIAIDRLKNMVTGRVKKMTSDEMRSIQAAYAIRDVWWISDKAPMLLSSQEQEIQPQLYEIGIISKELQDIDIEDHYKRVVQEMVSSFRRKDGAAITQQIDRLCQTSLQSIDGSFVRVPRYDIRASAGGGSVIHDESIVDHLAFKREWLTQSMGCAPEQVCVIQVRGDSMTPTINDADLLLLDMRQVNTRTEGVYVIQLQGSLLVKRLRFKVNGAVDVISDNTRYGIETLTSHEVNQLTVLGRVVWHGGKF